MNVVFVGPVGAGKTSLLQRICYGETLGSAPSVCCCTYRPDEFDGALFWDTPGDDRFSWTADTVTKRAQVVVYCEELGRPHERNYGLLNPDAAVLLVSTKADAYEDSRCAPAALRTSAVTGEGVADLVAKLHEELAANAPTQELPQVPKPRRSKKRHGC